MAVVSAWEVADGSNNLDRLRAVGLPGFAMSRSNRGISLQQWDIHDHRVPWSQTRISGTRRETVIIIGAMDRVHK